MDRGMSMVRPDCWSDGSYSAVHAVLSQLPGRDGPSPQPIDRSSRWLSRRYSAKIELISWFRCLGYFSVIGIYESARDGVVLLLV